jgi:hypothetical protein
MLICPLCKNAVAPVAAQCPRCQANLSLLCDVRDRITEGLSRAEAATRAGSLEAAVWAYLEVLEVDPDNPTARRQLARVATAVRQFDRPFTPSRRLRTVGKLVLCLVLLAVLCVAAYYVGYRTAAA